MRDKKGVERGACHQCDCQEYETPASGYSCEYCGHYPAEHVNNSFASPSKPIASSTATCTTPSAPAECPCVNCSRPLARDSSGAFLDYCGRTCASGSCVTQLGHIHRPPARPGAPQTTPLPNASVPGGASAPALCPCVGCTRPRFVDSGRTLDFCGRTCATGACVQQLGHQRPGNVAQAPPGTCKCIGCNRPCAANPAGGLYDFCGRTCGSGSCGHARASATGTASSSGVISSAVNHCSCIGCTRPRHGGHQFCSRSCGVGSCGHPRPVAAPQGHGTLTPLAPSDPKYASVANQFAKSWRHSNKALPSIRAVFAVDSSKHVARFEAYKQRIIQKRPHLAHGGHGSGTAGNTHRRFHGTKLGCGLSPSNSSTCGGQGCSVCSILKSGFLMRFAQSNIGFGRFGGGLYFSSTSSKANDYAKPNSAGYKAMFVTHVVVGDAEKLYNDCTNLTQPPNGKDSVIGQPSAGGSLNYDELIIYNDDAARVLYLILYV